MIPRLPRGIDSISQRPSQPDPGPSPGNQPGTALTLEPGQMVGNYAVERMLRSGSWSAVYRARDTLLDRVVAIKQLMTAKADEAEALVQRARSDGLRQKQAARDQTKHLVQLVDIIDDQHGLMLITDFVEGRSLETVLAQDPGPMAPRRAVTILAALAKGLRALHGREIIHQDLKPTNVLLGDNGSVKISDFGLASILQDQENLSLASPRYSAPEVLLGDTPDARADLYSLGMIGYEMLAGRDHFDQAFKTILRDARHQPMRWTKWHTNPRTHAPALSTMVERIDPQVEALINRLLEKDPQRRFSSADDVLSALGRMVGGQGTGASAQGPTSGEQAQGQTQTGAAREAASQHQATSTTTPGDTAAIPKRSRVLSYVGLATLAVGLAVGAYFAANRYGQRQSRRQARLHEARQLLDSARAAYDEAEQARKANRPEAARRQYTRSNQLFEKLGDSYAKVPNARARSEAGLALTHGELAMLNARFDQASELFGKVRKMRITDQDRRAKLLRRQDQAGRFGAFAQAASSIQSDLTGGRYTQASKQISQWRGFHLTQSEQSQLDNFARTLYAKKANHALQSTLAKAREQARAGNKQQAAQTLQQALPDPSEQGLEGPTIRKMQSLYHELTADQRFKQLLASARAAAKAGNLDQAIGAYQDALAIGQSDEVRSQLTNLQSRRLYERGQAQLDQGNTTVAERLFTAALGKNPDHAGARKALKNIESAGRKNRFVRAAESAMASGEFQTAVKQYTNALKLADSEALQTKLREARLRLKHRQGLEALDAGKVNRARKLLTEAKQINPQDPAVNEALRTLKDQAAYQKQKAAGDKARARGDFGQALRRYNQAQKIDDTPEIRQAKTEAQHAQMVANARVYIDNKHYQAAKGMLEAAARIKMTDEIKRLRKRIEEAQQHGG